MSTTILVWLLATFALGTIPVANGQQAKVPKIGWLQIRPANPDAGLDFLRRELRAFGYVEGQNIAFEFRSADNKPERIPALADELIRINVDLLLTASANVALAAKHATRTIPIVFLSVSDPVANRLVDSLARPGGNLTGFTTIGTELAGKRLELLKETYPKFARIAVLWNPQNPTSAQEWNESQLLGKKLGLQLYSMEVSSADKYESAFKKLTKVRNVALAATLDALVNTNQKRIVDLAARARLPAIYPRGDFVENGGLMSYGADQAEPYRRVARMVDKILKGTKPADLPVEQPMKFEFVVNLNAAKQIGLTIPPNVLARADRVIR